MSMCVFHPRAPRMPALLATRRWAAVAALVGAALVGTGASAQTAEYDDVSRLTRAGQLEQALVKADQYLSAQPKDPQMRFLKGVIEQRQGKVEAALATFTQLTQDYPELPEPYNNLAVILASQNQIDKARVALEMAVRNNPDYATAHENLGDIYARLAAQSYGKALQLDAQNTTAPAKLRAVNSLLNPGAPVRKPAR